MPPKQRQARLGQTKTGSVEVRELVPECEVVEDSEVMTDNGKAKKATKKKAAPPKKKQPRKGIKKVATPDPQGDSDEEDDDDELDLKDCEIEIDFALGSKVFGFRDRRNGKFVPKANYSIRIDAFCDGIRFSHPSWQVTVFDRKKTTQVLLPDNLDKLKDISTHISGVLKRPVYADLPEKMFRTWFKKQLVEHISSRDVTKVIVSYTGYQEEDIDISDPKSFLCVLGHLVLDENGIPVDDHKYVFSPEVVQRRVDAKSNIAKLVQVPVQLLTPSSARDQFIRMVQALPCGASDIPCKLLTAGYMMLLASPITDKVPDLIKCPLIALVGSCSLGKTATNCLLLNHFSDKVYMENGTTKSQSLEAKIKTTSLILYGDDFRSQDTESKICNAVYDKIGTTTKSGGSLNDPQASVIYSTNVTEPRIPRVRGRSIFLTMKPWMDCLTGKELDQKKKDGILLTNTKEKALPFLLSLVKRSVSSGFIERFTEIKNGPFCSQLPIKSDQRLLNFYALLFSWLHEFAYEFPTLFDRDATLEWVNGTLTAELKHYYALDDSSKTDFERWLFAFGAEVEKMTVYQKLRVTRITTPNKICGGMRCLLVNSKRCPVALGSKISDFKEIVLGIGGESNSSQVVLSCSSTDTKLVTKGAEKNTEGKRCYMVPLSGLSKPCKSFLCSVFDVEDSDDSDDSVNTESDTDSGSDSTPDIVEEPEQINQESPEPQTRDSHESMEQPNQTAKPCKAGPSAHKGENPKEKVKETVTSPRRQTTPSTRRQTAPAPRRQPAPAPSRQTQPSPRRLRPRKKPGH